LACREELATLLDALREWTRWAAEMHRREHECYAHREGCDEYYSVLERIADIEEDISRAAESLTTCWERLGR
jgi:hypothetical protein